MRSSNIGGGICAFGGLTPQGELNATLYPPGVVCEAMHGCPVNRNCWSVVTWYPGKETLMRCFPNAADARAWIEANLR